MMAINFRVPFPSRKELRESGEALRASIKSNTEATNRLKEAIDGMGKPEE